jgi:hypothetical protein
LDLGMKMDVENTENGCTMKISNLNSAPK